jgi:NAD(P)H-dependent FMN reductase
MTHPYKLGLIQGSIREGRFNDVVARWASGGLAALGFAVTTIDPADPDLLPVQTGDAAAVAAFRRRLHGLDGFVIVTPEYNHAAPGPLKTLIDSAGREWEAKPVGFVCYGGLSGGLRAVESLRIVLAELHAVALRDTVSFSAPWNRFDPSGTLIDRDDAQKSGEALAAFAARLRWWIETLSAAAAREPYRERTA